MEHISQRLDMEMLKRNLADSRAKAQAMVSDQRVLVNGILADKPSRKITPEHIIEIIHTDVEWVGRGAFKLLAALDHFGFDPENRIAADIGASTGGFCHVLLEKGAKRVYAIDVGHDQLHKSLIEDERLINLEGVNARYIAEAEVPEPLDMVVSDVSFISLKKALPAALGLCAPGAVLAALVKPQFEVGKGNLGKGGIVRDPELVEQVRLDMESWVNALPGWKCLGSIDSPITGSDGNREYLLGAIFGA